MAYVRLGMMLFLVLSGYSEEAKAACAGVKTVPNRVLALVDGREETPLEASRIAREIAGPLAQKGLYPFYVDVSKPLPAAFDTTSLAGVISWFTTDVSDAQKLAAWLAARDSDCGEALAQVAIGEMGGASIWQRFGVDRTRATILHDGARDKIEVLPNWRQADTPIDVAPGVVLAPPLPPGGAPIVQIGTEQGGLHVLGFQRRRQTWLSDQLMQGPAGKTAINLERVLASYRGEGLSPVPDLAMFQGRRIALSVLLADGWERRSPPSGSASLGTPAYAFVRKVFPRDAAPLTFGWPDPAIQTAAMAPEAAAAVKDLAAQAHVLSLPRTEPQAVLSLGSPPVIRLLPASLEGSDAFPRPTQSTITPLSGPAGFGDPTGVYARAAAVLRSETPWPFGPDTLVVRAQDLLTETGRAAVAQARALHASPSRAAMDLAQYADLLQGAVSTRITPIGPARWEIANRGALHTLRFEPRDRLRLDVDLSMGVLGSRTIGSALFVALDPAVETALVALKPAHSGSKPGPQTIEFVEAGPKLERLHREGCRTTARVDGSGQITVRAKLEPQILLGDDQLPVTPLPENLWRFRVPDDHQSASELSIIAGCD